MREATLETKAVLFDADGVLFHSYDLDGVFNWSRTIEQDLGLPKNVAEAIFDKGWHDVLRGVTNAPDHVADVFTQHDIRLPVQTYIDYWLSKDRDVNTEVARLLEPGTSYIATNQDRLRAKEFKEIFAGRVRKVYASSDIGALKPLDAYYEYIENDLRLAPHQIWFIDDSAPNVHAAEKRGWNAHHFTTVEGLTRFLEVRPAMPVVATAHTMG